MCAKHTPSEARKVAEMSEIVPKCVLPIGCELGEGPVWRTTEQALWFVDIKQDRVHRWNSTTGAHRTWPTPPSPSFLAPLANGQWIVGLKSGLHRFDPVTGSFEHVCAVEDPSLNNRLNDGFVDPQGRLWFGSMHDDETVPTGALYRYDSQGLARVDASYCITNGPCTSPDESVFYHTDTLQRLIYAYDLWPDGGIANRRRFVRLSDSDGYPDGSSVDAEGCVWIGVFGGWAARRYSPQGELLLTVRFPVANVTKIAFGGANLMTAYATTARKGQSAAALVDQPLAGALFQFPLPAPGLPQHEARYF
jgi:sugar lactone lactonase YvrE